MRKNRSIVTFLVLLTLIFIDSSRTFAQVAPNATGQASSDGQLRTQSQSQTGTADTPPRSSTRPARSSARDSYVRLARAPNMFGDSLRPTGSLVFREQTGQLGSNINLMLAGGGSYNVAENNKALPMDRVYFQYNGFANALPSNPGGQTSLHMYSLGFEKTFFDGLWSVDLRMPFNSGFAFNSNSLSSDSGNVGNLSMFLKGLLYQDEGLAIASGLGIGLPTGSDSVTTTQFDQLTVQNQAIHLMPFLAFTAAPNEDWFFQAFTQIDFAASGNDVVSSQGALGVYTEQNILHLDTTIGRWFAQNLGYRHLSGIAGVLELHYASSIQDSDSVPVSGGSLLGEINVPDNRFDLLNLTSGLHFQLTPLSNLRVGAVVPLRASPDRVFDSEIQASFNRYF